MKSLVAKGIDLGWVLGFGLAKFGGLAFLALVAKLKKKCSYGFCGILVGNCHKYLNNEV